MLKDPHRTVMITSARINIRIEVISFGLPLISGARPENAFKV
jgi:hypothetical protein